MAGPNSLGRRADFEEAVHRIDSHISIAERSDILKARRGNRESVRYLFCVVYTSVGRLCGLRRRLRPGVKSNMFFRWIRRFEHLRNRVKHRLKSGVVALIHRVNFLGGKPEKIFSTTAKRQASPKVCLYSSQWRRTSSMMRWYSGSARSLS